MIKNKQNYFLSYKASKEEVRDKKPLFEESSVTATCPPFFRADFTGRFFPLPGLAANKERSIEKIMQVLSRRIKNRGSITSFCITYRNNARVNYQYN
jgi:hypothetical protein